MRGRECGRFSCSLRVVKLVTTDVDLAVFLAVFIPRNSILVKTRAEVEIKKNRLVDCMAVVIHVSEIDIDAVTFIPASKGSQPSVYAG